MCKKLSKNKIKSYKQKKKSRVLYKYIFSLASNFLGDAVYMHVSVFFCFQGNFIFNTFGYFESVFNSVKQGVAIFRFTYIFIILYF